MKTICIIPARGGSVRIERKNIKDFHGKPMLQRAVELARSCRLFDRIVVSTDDNEIAAVAHALGGDVSVFRRPMDDGTKGTQELARDVLADKLYRDASIACVLYPCTPLLTADDLMRGYRTVLNRDLGVYAMSVDDAGGDAGGYYWGWASAFARAMPLDGNVTGCKVPYHFDINTQEDWSRAEAAFTAPEKATKVPASVPERMSKFDTAEVGEVWTGDFDQPTQADDKGETEESVTAAPRDPGKPTSTLDFWQGSFGNDYTDRNLVPWSDRVPFWRRIVEHTRAESFLDVGCNAGWNMQALRSIDAKLAMTGVDINDHALDLAKAAGLDVEKVAAWDIAEHFGTDVCDLTITSGVLIHIAPEDLQRTMKAIRDTSKRWVVAIEYDALQETEVTYRGHAGRLWKRPYGELYKVMGLALVEFGPAVGFDDCTYWLMEKP